MEGHNEIKDINLSVKWIVWDRSANLIVCWFNSLILVRENRDRTGTEKFFQTRLVPCSIEEDENEENLFSPVVDYTVMKLDICIAMQRAEKFHHVEFEIAFPNEHLDQQGLVEISEYVLRMPNVRIMCWSGTSVFMH